MQATEIAKLKNEIIIINKVIVDNVKFCFTEKMKIFAVIFLFTLITGPNKATNIEDFLTDGMKLSKFKTLQNIISVFYFVLS